MAPRKLSAEQVAKIRGTALCLRELAEEMGVDKVAIWKVRNGETYKKFPAAPPLQPILLQRECRYCFETFQPARRNHIYCTAACRKKSEGKRLYSRMKLGLETGDAVLSARYNHYKELRRQWRISNSSRA